MVTDRYVVGVDGGASKTVALVGTVEGEILGRGETGSSNYHNVGSTLAGKAIKNAVLEAQKKAGLSGTVPKTAVVALAAIDSQKDRHVTSRFVRLTRIAKTSFVIHDSVAALYAARKQWLRIQNPQTLQPNHQNLQASKEANLHTLPANASRQPMADGHQILRQRIPHRLPRRLQQIPPSRKPMPRSHNGQCPRNIGTRSLPWKNSNADPVRSWNAILER